MKPLFYSALILAAAALMGLSSCKTSEENYRQAYEKAIEGRNAENALDSTIYGKARREIQRATAKASDGSDIEVRRQLVKVTKDGGGIRENLHRYCVVVGQFKQHFNASSLRNRLVDAGYPGAFLVETSEPYYYVVLGSYDTISPAISSLEEFKGKNVIAMRSPLPFILDATAR